MVKYSNKRLGRSFIKKRMTKRSSKMTRRRNAMKMYRGGGIQLLTFIAGLVVLSLSDAKYTVTPSNTKNSHEIDAKVARIHNNVFDAGEKLRVLMSARGFTTEDKDVVFKRIKKITKIIYPVTGLLHDPSEFDDLQWKRVYPYLKELIARESMIYVLEQDEGKSITDSGKLFDKMSEAPPPELSELVKKRLDSIKNSYFSVFYPPISKIQHMLGWASREKELQEIITAPHL